MQTLVKELATLLLIFTLTMVYINLHYRQTAETTNSIDVQRSAGDYNR